MTAPVGAVDHAAARATAEEWTRNYGPSANAGGLGRAYLDLDARLGEMEAALTAIGVEATGLLAPAQVSVDERKRAVWAFVKFCSDICADAIDAAHGETKA